MWYNDTADGIDSIDSDGEIGITDSLEVDEFEIFDLLDMMEDISIIVILSAETMDVGERIIVGFGDADHLLAFGIVEELTVGVEEFEGIPLHGVMAGSDDDTAASLFSSYSEFGGGCRSHADIHDIESHGYESANYEVFHHFAGEASIATHHYSIGITLIRLAKECSVSGSKLHDIDTA